MASPAINLNAPTTTMRPNRSRTSASSETDIDATPVARRVAAGVGWITLNTPRALNAITLAMSLELKSALLDLADDPDVKVVVIQGAGGTFCGGGHFSEIERLRPGGPAAIRPLFTAFRRVCEAIADVDIPVIAAVQGLAVGAGFELMQAADIVLISAEAVIADTHLDFGLVPAGGSTHLLPRLVGRQAALAIILSGDRISGADAVSYGLAYRSFPEADFTEAVQRFVSGLARRDRTELSMVKRLVHAEVRELARAERDGEADSAVAHIRRRATPGR
jgi:enoyl-CoA hydratase/carnithine racemase